MKARTLARIPRDYQRQRNRNSDFYCGIRGFCGVGVSATVWWAIDKSKIRRRDAGATKPRWRFSCNRVAIRVLIPCEKCRLELRQVKQSFSEGNAIHSHQAILQAGTCSYPTCPKQARLCDVFSQIDAADRMVRVRNLQQMGLPELVYRVQEESGSGNTYSVGSF